MSRFHSKKFLIAHAPLAAVFLLTALPACQSDHVEGHLFVGTSDRNVIVHANTANGDEILGNGEYQADVNVALLESGTSLLELHSTTERDAKAIDIPLRGVSRKSLMSLADSETIDASSLGQPFSIVIKHFQDDTEDRFDVRLIDPRTKEEIANGDFRIKPDGSETYAADSMTFLRSFQEVRRSQRGLFFASETQAGPMIGLWDDTVGPAVSAVSDFVAMAYIAPWLQARYSHIEWFMGNPNGEKANAVKIGWAKLLRDYPVVDYFTTLHQGTQYDWAEPLDGLPRKRNQLRLMYTTACESGSSAEFVQKYNFAIAVGHAGISASPFVVYKILRGWAYGYNVADAVSSAWSWARAEIKAGLFFMDKGTSIGYWSNKEDLLEETEPWVSYTSELTPDRLEVSTSAVPKRSSPETATILEKSATQIKNGVSVTPNQSLK